MREFDQRTFLYDAKKQLNMTWDELAEAAHIRPLALRSYRMPEDSKARRKMPILAVRSIERLLV
ncbi:MAG: hypothetical protein GY820_07190 [Gammaproteobacteria bacterium]|nr:hypothetical protein [Gammaproteobacteria bacterium]